MFHGLGIVQSIDLADVSQSLQDQRIRQRVLPSGDAAQVQHGDEARYLGQRAAAFGAGAHHGLQCTAAGEEPLTNEDVGAQHVVLAIHGCRIQKAHVPLTHSFDHDHAALAVTPRQPVMQKSPVPQLLFYSPGVAEDAVNALALPPAQDVTCERASLLYVTLGSAATTLQQSGRGIADSRLLQSALQVTHRMDICFGRDLLS
mmetsp:Transcript_38286/g.109896  ORF Transcript_38286/g.109896 Transcript_38286/m.109896 type:complete len:202 (-) Transcript_38286:302-907(-)